MKIRIVVGALLCILSCSSVKADLYSTRPSEQMIRQATLQCTRAATTPQSNILGISDPNTLDPAVISLVKETGVNWVRAEFHWSRIQTTPDTPYNWALYDNMVNSFRNARINVLGILTYIPPSALVDWKLIDNSFQNFASAAVQRYRSAGVHYWEIFNEPNLPGFGWLSQGTDPRKFIGAYVLLLARANQIIRKYDPAGIVVIGGLASDNHGGIPSEEFMRSVYSYGAKDCFDVLAFHPYGYQNKFPSARSRVNLILDAGGDQGKSVWFNEYGWTDYNKMNMEVYKTSATNPMMAVFKQDATSDALFWFSAKDYSSKLGTPTFGLADFYGNKRESFATFKYLVGTLRALNKTQAGGP